jgi:hypothetical protein
MKEQWPYIGSLSVLQDYFALFTMAGQHEIYDRHRVSTSQTMPVLVESRRPLKMGHFSYPPLQPCKKSFHSRSNQQSDRAQ